MRRPNAVILAGASLIALSFAATATAAPAASATTAAAEEATLGEIVVTARRRAESLQEVPQAVSAVTSDTLQKLEIKQFADIQAVVPGLTLQTAQNGYGSGASLRGVTYNVLTGANPTVAMYFNDAPTSPTFIFESLFDVGQIEVLRGPQGTTRGVSAPSGAITITTHKPDLSQFGGYVDTTLTDLQGRNVQAAVNVPLIKDVLAVRVAGVIDQNNAGGVRSVNNNIAPRQVTGAERVSVSFEPTDRFDANISYQHLDRDLTSFTQVYGPGNGTAADPAISVNDRASVQDGANRNHQHIDLLTGQIDSRIFGQHLSYVGSYQRFKLTTMSPQDTGNVVPGDEFYQTQSTTSIQTTQEIRLASDPAPGRFFDYTVGGYYSWMGGPPGHVNTVGTFFPGAFGPPGTFNPGAFNPAYELPIFVTTNSQAQETSLFGSVTLHLPFDTELSGGIRHIISIGSNSTALSEGVGRYAVNLPFSCARAGLQPSAYSGACDVLIGPAALQSYQNRYSLRPNIYNVSLSHHITRDLLVYANTGTSFRPGPTVVGITNGTNNPVLNSLTFLQPETSREYEVGIKSTFLDGRARVNLALWRQRFHNLFVYFPSIPYVSNNGSGAPPVVTTGNFTANADALVQGVDLDSAFQITPDWNLAFQYSYAQGHIEQSSRVPCNDSNFDGIPDNGKVTKVSQFPAGTLVALCPGGNVSQNPLWNASLQTEYTHPVREGMNGFLRALVTYYPQNKYAEPGFVVPNYSLVNLYAGLRSQDGAWEVSVFARNAFLNQTLLDRSAQTQTLGALGSFFPTHNVSNYSVVLGDTPQREVGVNVHYAWGSR